MLPEFSSKAARDSSQHHGVKRQTESQTPLEHQTENFAVSFLNSSAEEEYGSSMMDWSSCPVVQRDPERVSGSWVFCDTRVPVVALFENLEGGASIDDFLSWFPGVTREQVEAVLEYTIQSLKADLQAA